MRRYRMETEFGRCWGLTNRWASPAAAGVTRCGWRTLATANQNDPEVLTICRTLTVGETATFGGGAAPMTRITREA